MAGTFYRTEKKDVYKTVHVQKITKMAENETGPSKTKVSRPKPSHPSFFEMAKAAIGSLADKKGSSVPSIQTYIAGNYNLELDFVKIHLKPALAKGIENGTFVRPKGSEAKGYTGRFKLDKAKQTEEAKAKAKKEKEASKTEKKPTKTVTKAKTKAKTTTKSPKKVVKKKTPTKSTKAVPKSPKTKASATKTKKAGTPKKAAKKPKVYHISKVIRQSFYPSKTIPKI